MRRSLMTITCASLLMFTLGCGGNPAVSPSTTPQPAQASLDEARSLLPLLPSGEQDVRRSQVVDGDVQHGDAAIDFVNGTPGGTKMLLLLPDEEYLAYARYQIPARPDPPDYFTINATYYDDQPLAEETDEGFWVAYADYAQDSWVFAGPFTTSQTRIEVPATADVISPSDNLYCIVIMLSGNVVMVHSVSASYYTDLNYESLWLEAPQGQFIGQRTDIQLDADGNPHIAYIRSDSWIDSEQGKIWLARQEAGDWVMNTVPTFYPVSNIVFRLGAGGRRAILAQSGHELHLLYDDGSGTFTSDSLVSANHSTLNMPAMTFFNAGVDPEGECDDLMIVYLEEDLWPDHYVKSYLYDGTNPPELQNIFFDPKDRIGRICLTTNADNTLLLGELSQPVPGEWLLNTMTYNEFGFWVGLPNVDWDGLPIEDDYGYNPGIATCELPNGDLAAAYKHEGGHGVVLGLSDSFDWQSELSDTIGCRAYPIIDLEPYSDGSVGFLSTYADNRLQLFRKQPAGGDTVQVTAIDGQLLDARCGSMAVDSGDVTHIATGSVNGEGLLYYTVDAEGVSPQQVVDSGGWDRGSAYGIPALATIGDDLYIFYCDQAHSNLVYSLNRNGVWITENELIPGTGLCNISWAAGYLENENLLYACYQNLWDYRTYVVTFTPGEDDFQVNSLTPALDEPLFIADDETNLGIAYIDNSIMLGYRLLFSMGPPRQSPHGPEVVSATSDSVFAPHPVNYNPFEETWLVGCHGEDVNSCLVHKRSPAGLWSGPNLVTMQPGAGNAFIEAINSDFFTGINYVTVSERAEGSTIRDINVYVDATDDRHFHSIANLMTFDTATYSVDTAVAAPTTNGWPVICLEVKPILDPDWNYKVMIPDSSFHWNPAFTWQTTCVDPIGWPGIAILHDDMPALAVIERSADSEQYGRVLVRYPW